MVRKPSRPSGVVSQQLLSTHHPCQNSSGSGRASTGIWNVIRVWSPCRVCPVGFIGFRGSKLPCQVTTVPPAAKLPCEAIVTGPTGVWEAATVNVLLLPLIEDLLERGRRAHP